MFSISMGTAYNPIIMCYESLQDRSVLSPSAYLNLIFGVRITKPLYMHTLSKNGRKFREAFVYIFFQASWAKNFDLLRVIAVHGTMTIEFYVEF